MANSQRQRDVNPFYGQSREQLYRAAWRLKEELEAPRTRTPEERRALVIEVCHLLATLAGMVYHEGPGAPAYDLKHHPGDLARVFLAKYDSDEIGVRTRALMRAAEFVFGTPQAANCWSNGGPGTKTKATYHELARQSRDGLRRGLEALQAIRKEKEQVPPVSPAKADAPDTAVKLRSRE